ncbi:MAG: signal peptide peptidase SppA [Proteobacteria bacterium]|nr:MAG: signal peptide peptidase SppA [Pseudomonadota bacterium]
MKSSWKPVLVVCGVSFFFFIAFVVSSFLFFARGFDGKSQSAQKTLFQKEGVGILEINGVIMDSKKALKTIRKFEDAKEVKALVVRVNSPGGAVGPSQEIYEALKKFPKPVVASMSSVAASGGFYISMAAQKIFANPGTITGSIGVIMEFANLEKLYEWAKVKRYVIKTGKFKDAGAEYREMAPEERALLQGMIDDVLLQFKTAVAEGRKLSLDEVTQVADGRVFSGNQALGLKMVDQLGTLDDAVNEAGKLAGIQGRPKVIQDDRKKSAWEMIQDQLSERDEDAESRTHVSDVLAATLRSTLGIPPTVEARTPGIYWLWKSSY